MGPLLRIPVIRILDDRQLLFPVVVVLVVSGVLVQGAWQRNLPAETADQEDTPAPLTPPVSRRPDLEKTSLTYFDDYWLQLRERVEDKVVLVGPEATPAVVVMPGLALTSAAAGEAVLADVDRAHLVHPPDEPSTGEGAAGTAAAVALPTGDGREPPPVDIGVEEPADPATAQASRPGGLISVDRDRGLALFEVDASRVQAFELIPPAALPSGSYVGAVTRDRTGRVTITPGHLVAARAETAGSEGPSLEVSMRLAGPGATAVVDLDGALVGVAGEAGAGPWLLSSSVVRRVVAELQRLAPCRALGVSALETPVLALLAIESGLLIEQGRQDAFVPEPSLRAGDVILEWDGEAVTTVEAFETRTDALEPGVLVRYQVLRGRRQLAGGTVLPGDDCRPVGDPPVQLARLGLALRWIVDGGAGARAGWRVAATAPGGAAAGLQRDDLVLSVDGRAVDGLDARAVFARMERRGEPALVTVQRADRVRILALDPGD